MNTSTNDIKDLASEIPDTMSLSEGLAILKRHIANSQQTTAEIDSLHLGSIRLLQPVFQRRRFEEGTASTSEDHVRTLLEAIFTSGSRHLDPITVWFSGQEWFVLDGHHRTLAYQRANKQGKLRSLEIPVEVFRGTLGQAMSEAVRLNSKDKLPMTKSDKLNSAWVLNLMGGVSKSEVSAVAKVSPSTVANMRQRIREIQASDPSMTSEVLMNMSWEEAQRIGQEIFKRDDEWAEKIAAEWAKRLARNFGSKLRQQPAIHARAIEIYSERHVRELLREWRDLVTEMGDELTVEF